MSTNKQANRLIHEKSPYLLQHAYNPVQWYPWEQEAFEKAKQENKPIFLSIGYSTCHWCHVMERESFEDNEIAEILNTHFVSIKVDREERPDIDSVYMNVCQTLTGQGGWPLSIFMTAEQKPFFAGTYFPKTDMRGMYGMKTLLNRIVSLWNQNKTALVESSQEIFDAIKSRELSAEKPTTIRSLEETSPIELAYQQFSQDYDSKYGGFSPAPKFPSPHNLLFLLRYWYLNKDSDALSMVGKTLESMYKGGIYDHIGFGFKMASSPL